MKSTLLFLLIFLIAINVFSQVSFTTGSEGLNQNTYSGAPAAVADMNGDFFDDVVIMDQTSALVIDQQINGSSKFHNRNIGNIGSTGNWAMVVGDVNNDGLGDVISGGYGGAIFMCQLDDMFDDQSFEPIPNSDFFLQGSNLVDLDNDGWLDYFGCDDNDFSKFYLNDQNGSLNPAWNLLNTDTDPVSDNSGNYGSTWTDFDNDGDLDLYIAKCRLGVSDTLDPRRVNMLLRNDDGNFINSAATYGIDIGWQSWSADFGDIDNDGDFDLVVTNHDAPSALMENDGSGHFTDITDSSGFVVTGQALQSIMRDVDNDGFLDILISGDQSDIFMNNGDNTFTALTNNPVPINITSMAVGDLNHDGFVDIFATHGTLYNGTSNTPDDIYLNDGNSNNFASFNLIGHESSRSAVGAKIKIYGSWGMQVREVRSGESYGISNSLQMHFGLGTAETIDSVQVDWSVTGTQTLYNLDANNFYFIHENEGCVSTAVDLTVSGELVFCIGESTQLTATEGASYIWSTGETTRDIMASKTGIYWAQTIDENGCTIHSKPVFISVDPTDEIPEVQIIGSLGLCQGESVTLMSQVSDSYTWSTGETSQSIEITEAGEYYVTVPGTCNDFSSQVFEVSIAIPADFYTEDDIIQAQESATLFAEGDSVNWYADAAESIYLASGNYYETAILDQTTSFYAEQYISPTGSDYNVGPLEPVGFNLYSTFNGGQEFTVFKELTIKSVTVFTETPGLRRIELRDAFNVPLETLDIELTEFETEVALNFTVPPGQFALTTNAELNEEIYGVASPQLQRSFDQSLTYPYVVEDVLSIDRSYFGTEYFYYYFDWKISTTNKLCEGNTQEVLAIVESVDTEELLSDDEIAMWPNPASEQLYLDWDREALKLQSIELFSTDGRLVKRANDAEIASGLLQITELQAGLYTIQVQSSNGRLSKKIIID